MIKTVPVFIALLTMLGGTWIFMDARWAKSEDLQNVASRLDYKIKEDQVLGLRQHIWDTQAHYCSIGSYCQPGELLRVPPPVQRELQRMKDDETRLTKELENLRNGKAQ